MTQPAGQNKLPNQTPNNNTPVVDVSVDVSTMLKDSTGKPITGILNAFGYVTPGWRYLMGRFLTSETAGAATTVNDAAVWANTAGTQLKDLAWSVVTQTLLTLFSSSKQGVVPASGGGTVNFLRADGTWAVPTSGLTYLGTVSVSGGALNDTTILAANSSTYRSFKLVMKNIIPGTNSVGLNLQVHSGGAFQTTTYLSTGDWNTGSATGGSSATTSVIMSQGAVQNTAPGLSGEILVSNLAGTSAPKMWTATWGHNDGASSVAAGNSAGYWNGGNGAIDGFQLVASSGTLASGAVDIYGVL